ncbi:hypothetical protein ACFX2J_042926 [Malus domestica]
MQEEFDAPQAQGTWQLVHPPSNRSIIGSKWVHKIKKNQDGSVSRYKARLVAQGCSQQEGLDYFETFSIVVRLIKSLYGLKQAPRVWNSKFTSFLPALGFKAALSDSSLFVHSDGTDVTLLLLYVDDIILTGSSALKIQYVITDLAKKQSIVSRSSTEAEYKALAHCAADIHGRIYVVPRPSGFVHKHLASAASIANPAKALTNTNPAKNRSGLKISRNSELKTSSVTDAKKLNPINPTNNPLIAKPVKAAKNTFVPKALVIPETSDSRLRNRHPPLPPNLPKQGPYRQIAPTSCKCIVTVRAGFPTWVSSKDRRLLQSSTNETKYDLVVARDDTGNFTTISEAVDVAPNSSATGFVIYIRVGAYFENVEVVKKKTNLMFLGDRIRNTIVKASRNVVDEWTTFRSVTVERRTEEDSTSSGKNLVMNLNP